MGGQVNWDQLSSGEQGAGLALPIEMHFQPFTWLLLMRTWSEVHCEDKALISSRDMMRNEPSFHIVCNNEHFANIFNIIMVIFKGISNKIIYKEVAVVTLVKPLERLIIQRVSVLFLF